MTEQRNISMNGARGGGWDHEFWIDLWPVSEIMSAATLMEITTSQIWLKIFTFYKQEYVRNEVISKNNCLRPLVFKFWDASRFNLADFFCGFQSNFWAITNILFRIGKLKYVFSHSKTVFIIDKFLNSFFRSKYINRK